jgi:hypothetical protein
VDSCYTNKAADRLREFDKPALIAWSREDRFFKPTHAHRLTHDLPNARLEWIENARTFLPEDEPGQLAKLIGGFLRASALGAAQTDARDADRWPHLNPQPITVSAVRSRR